MLKESGIPTAEFDGDLTTYADLCCALLDIPVYKSRYKTELIFTVTKKVICTYFRVQSLHVMFTLFAAFKNSQHFNQLAQV